MKKAAKKKVKEKGEMIALSRMTIKEVMDIAFSENKEKWEAISYLHAYFRGNLDKQRPIKYALNLLARSLKNQRKKAKAK